MSEEFLSADIRKKLREFELQVRFTCSACRERASDASAGSGTGCLGILGPSGCGKSMTLKSIAGIVEPDSGSIILDGRELFNSSRKVNLKPQKRRVGYLFQNYALFPNMTVEENILTGLKAGKRYGEAQQKKRVSEMIERFRLSGLEKRYPAQLSGGQQQRVALARILAYEPEALLLDEPFSAMDTHLRERLRLELASVLSEYQGASVMVTHDRDEAYQLCDTLLLLSRGQVIAAGKTKELFQDPGSVEAARLTGCKNISRIEKIDDHRVCALDWDNLELSTEKTVTEDVTSIGIRAHDFEPVKDPEGINHIPVGHAKISEMPFEWYVTLQNGLWWKIGKTIHTHSADGLIPEYVRVAPEAILLLKG